MSEKNPEFRLLDPEQLSIDLIDAQYALKDSRGQDNAKSLVILMSGIELAGKGEAVQQLREWVDPRYLHVKADPAYLFKINKSFWEPYVNYLPAEGQMLVMYSNWYSDLLATAMHVSDPMDDTLFDAYVKSMQEFEQDLKNNHVDVIKIWFDLSWKTLQKRLDKMDAAEQRWHKLHGLDWHNKKQYDDLQKLRKRFTDDWYLIDCEKEEVRDQQFAQYILKHLKDMPVHTKESVLQWNQAEIPEVLLKPSQTQIDKDDYKTELKKLSAKVAEALRFDNRRIVIAFEGMDAAGKGGAIKRIVKKLDPREYAIYPISAPEKYELARPYLWRFWTKICEDESISIFDRTWYGRVLVERVDQFASDVEWQRAYDEINRFEKDLYDSKTVIIKFWLAISKDEQEKRFKSRESMPYKNYKITPDDWHNRENWDKYLNAAADMLARTDTFYAPWHVIATDDKYTARLDILRAILKQLNVE